MKTWRRMAIVGVAQATRWGSILGVLRNIPLIFLNV